MSLPSVIEAIRNRNELRMNVPRFSGAILHPKIQGNILTSLLIVELTDEQ